MEALNNTLLVSSTTPLATRAAGPGPIVNPITPTVTITSVGGQLIPQPAQGGLGKIDLVLPAPGQTEVGFSTSGVPTGNDGERDGEAACRQPADHHADRHAGDAQQL